MSERARASPFAKNREAIEGTPFAHDVVMDPRWELSGDAGPQRDQDVEWRDLEILSHRNVSPWEIGQRHWTQRDLYTTNGRSDDAGYALGPALHPDVGSYAYVRSPSPISSEVQMAQSFREDSDSTHSQKGMWHRLVRNVFGPSESTPWRSDTRIHDEACSSLSDDGYVDASDITVEVESGEVTLSGTVSDRAEKKRAEELVSACGGVLDVHNRLTIRKDHGDDRFAFTMPTITAS